VLPTERAILGKIGFVRLPVVLMLTEFKAG
jgi:hypothetical protein